MANLRFPGRFGGAQSIIPAPQDITGAWANLGDPVRVEGARTAGLWVNLDINNSQNVRIRALVQHTDGGSQYLIPIRAITASQINVQPEFVEFTNDVDQLMVLASDLEGIVRYIQWQVMAGTVGITPAQIDSAEATTGI